MAWLKELRRQKGMTQEDVAAQAGISRSYYTRIENGRFNIPVFTAMRIAGVLGFDWTKFYKKAS